MGTISDLQVSIGLGCYRRFIAIGLSDGQLLEEFELTHAEENVVVSTSLAGASSGSEGSQAL